MSSNNSSAAVNEPNSSAPASTGIMAWLTDPDRRGPLLVAPALLLLFVMNIFPLMWSFGLSFFHYKASSMREPVFAGLYYYKKYSATLLYGTDYKIPR